MIFEQTPPTLSPLRKAINQLYRKDETECIEDLLAQAELPQDKLHDIAVTAKQLVEEVRKRRVGAGGLDAFLYQYDLSSEEGIALMCLAEAMLRIPDASTIDRLIRDKISAADWATHLGQSRSLLVNVATWGLMLTGKILSKDEVAGVRGSLKKFIERSSEPVIRQTVAQAMKILGKQFVMGQTIEEALKRAKGYEKQGYRYSYDMLGEAARTAKDAERYFKAYEKAIAAIGQAAKGRNLIEAPGISIKLSALHPRYEYAKRERVLAEVTPRLKTLAQQAMAMDIGLTVDAEEAERLDLSLDIIETVFSDPCLKGWEGFGLAVQSYQKRAPAVIDWLIDLSRRYGRRIMIRLIKGAYWDTEVKVSQVSGFEGYPVFTRKIATDVSFLACVKKILAAPDAFYAQFATHNAYSVAAILELTKGRTDFEFQCLHGMGYTLYDQVVGQDKYNIPCRVYAPVGGHEDLLAYLVRRLLENGANTSFVNRILDERLPIDEIISDPVAKLRHIPYKPHPHIPLPVDVYGSNRKNSHGLDFSNPQLLQQLVVDLEAACKKDWLAEPLVAGTRSTEAPQPVLDPSNHQRIVGQAINATVEQVDTALAQADAAASRWDNVAVEQRAICLERAAELLELRRAEFMAMAIREAGKTLPDAIAEVREAIDFCYYYAARAREDLKVVELPGPTGEYNAIQLRGRGIVACISPWNFPLAIFMGQVTAALVAGNAVIAKPADQTRIIATAAVRLLHDAGIPQDVLQLVPGRGSVVGSKLAADQRIKAILFTGSTETARTINQTLADRQGPLVPFVAETGGMNAMIVDSSALPEQVVADVLSSAFGSAGQRCSALRILFVQEDIAPKLIEMLCGAMAELRLGDPSLLSTDIGPVIDANAKKGLEAHAARMEKEGKLLFQMAMPPKLAQQGSFFAPRAFEIDSLKQLTKEEFGPILHVIRFKGNELDKVIADINATGYGLTLGIHSRIEATVAYIHQRLRVGNTYVNRNMIGAVVGVQPFGGEGLSGTGPKAGGPDYIRRLCTERTLTINTTAAGGNASLMSLQE